MTKSELTANLKEWELEHLYSLDGSLEPDKYILYHNYSVWEFSSSTKKEVVVIWDFFIPKKKLTILFIKML